MQLDEMAGNRQAEAETAMLARERAVALPELVEDVGEKRSRDPDAAVGDLDHAMLLPTRDVDGDGPPVRSELHRIRHQIPDDLLQPSRIAADEDRLGRADVDADLLGSGRRCNRVD